MKKILFIALMLIPAIVVTLFVSLRLDVKPGGGMLSVTLSNKVYAQDELGGYYDIVFNPTGTHFTDFASKDDQGQLKIRLDFYPKEGTKAFEQQYVYMPVEPLPPYPGKVDEFGSPIDLKEYETWYDQLPKEWRLNPALCLFVKIDSLTTVADLESYLSTTFTPEMMATIDDVIVREDSAHLISPLLKDKNIIDAGYSVGDKVTILSDTNTKFDSFYVSGDGSSEPLDIQPQSIDVGPGAVDGNYKLTYNWTYIDVGNPANADGVIDTWEVWYHYNASNVEVATFYEVSAAHFSTRDTELIGSVTAGSKQTFSGKETDIVTGDNCGHTCTAGAMESSYPSSYSWRIAGDQIPCTNVEFGSYFNEATSIYGTGTESGGDPEISVLPISYDFGVVAESTTPYTATDYFTITNNSTMQTDQTISVTSATWTGGVTWTHSDTATAGSDTAGLKANKDGTWGVSDVIVKYSSPNYISENCSANTSYSFGLKLISPTVFTDGVEKTITVRITATAD